MDEGNEPVSEDIEVKCIDEDIAVKDGDTDQPNEEGVSKLRDLPTGTKLTLDCGRECKLARHSTRGWCEVRFDDGTTRRIRQQNVVHPKLKAPPPKRPTPAPGTRPAVDPLAVSFPAPTLGRTRSNMTVTSAWEEGDPIVEGLTMYEVMREPRTVLKPGTELEQPSAGIDMELKCPICLGILSKTVVVMECLHRFCNDCIEKYLRIGRNECPSCRIHVPTRRFLRSDVTLDALIGKIHPDLRVYEENEERDFQAMLERGSTVPLTTSEARKRQKRHAPVRRQSESSNEEAQEEAQEEEDPIDSIDDIDFSLNAFHGSSLPLLEPNRFRTSSATTITQVKKFLQLKFPPGVGRELDITVSNNGKVVMLDDAIPLQELQNTFSEAYQASNGGLQLYYRKSILAGRASAIL